MEDALVLQDKETYKNSNNTSLNPCFNGRCTSTRVLSHQQPTKLVVLILVLMEDALVPKG